MSSLNRVYVALILLVVGIVAGSSVGGCSFEPGIASGAFACAADRSCPNGMQCSPVDNRCYRPGTEPPLPLTGEDGGGGGNDGGPPRVPAVRILDAPAIAEGTAAAATDAGAGDGGASDGGASTAAQATFAVKLDIMPISEVKVDFATADGTANAGTDYTAKTGTVVFPAGSDTQTIAVDIVGDITAEPTETFTIKLSNPIGATIQSADATGTILDDDGTPEVSISDSAANEGDTGSTPFTFAATLSHPSQQAITVHWATVNGSASPPDFAAASGDLTFPPGTTSQNIDVSINGDVTNELDETFSVVLSAPVNATLGKATGTGTIKNDDGVPVIGIAGVSAVEGTAGTKTFDFLVSLSTPSGRDVSVDYTTADGTATAASGDYATAAGQLTIPAGMTSGTISVTVNGDTLHEPNETFTVKLSNASNGLLGTTPEATGTIQNDDAAPTLSIDGVTLTEGNVGVKNFVFNVTLSAVSAQTITVGFATADGTATTASDDYNAVSGSLTFPPGTITQTITVPVNGNTLNENDETFSVVLSNPVNATIATGTGTGTIQNDDPVPTLSIGDVALTEGAVGTKSFVFPVTLSAPSGQTVTVNYATANGTATTGNSDYTSASGTLTFAPGETTQDVTVGVIGDVTDEPNETFVVNLTSPANATILNGTGTGTILNDDGPLPTLSINDASAAEGSNIVFTVTLSAASISTVTVDYSTGSGTATAGTDYTSGSGTLTFSPGQLTKTITIATTADTLYEANETFVVDLSNPTNANLADAQGTGTINNNDPLPTLTIDSPSVAEGSSGTAPLTFTVTLSAASGTTTTVDFATSNGTATTASGCGGSDYTATSGTLTFPPGTTSQTIGVTVNGDTLYEPNETLLVTLSSPVNAAISGTGIGTGTITNDDGSAPAIAIADVSQNEGNSSQSAFNFAVTLSKQSSQTITVNYATADGTATTANNDYVAKSGTVTFSGCTTNQTISVNIVGDTSVEENEAFTVELSGAANATIADTSGTGTIVNDDNPLPTVSIGSVSQNEGSSGGGTVDFVFSVTLSAPSTQQIQVDWSTANGTAIANGDYEQASGKVQFAPGETSKTIVVKVKSDTTYEADETFTVNLSNPKNATIGTGTGTGTIVNDDTAPTLSIDSPAAVTEGNAGTQNLVFTVTQSFATEVATTVNFATAADTATAPGDYTSTSGTLTIPAGATSATISVPIVGDAVYELEETFFVNLSTPVNATIANGQGTGTIVDNDPIPTLAIDNVSMNEGNGGGKTNFVFTVTLTGATTVTTTVDWATADGTACNSTTCTANSNETNFGDYNSASGTLTFSPGETTKTITVQVNRDNHPGSDETFFVNLTNPVAATIADAQGVGTIQNDD